MHRSWRPPGGRGYDVPPPRLGASPRAPATRWRVKQRRSKRTPPNFSRVRSALVPVLAAVDDGAAAAGAELRATGATLHASIVTLGTAMRTNVERLLGRAFDTADIARLRDRAKLHIIVDDTLATAIGRFAADVAETVAQRLRAAAQTAVVRVVQAGSDAATAGELHAILAELGAERLPLTEDAAAAFGADAGSGAWSSDLETGLRSTIVLGALGGPAVTLVTAIAQRFADEPYGTYMKRELLADVRAGLFAPFDAELAAYVGQNADRVQTIAQALADRVAALGIRIRGQAVGAVDRALATSTTDAGRRSAGAAAAARAQAQRIAALATRIETLTETFAREARSDRNERADPAIPLDETAGRRHPQAAADARFDPQTYEHGLRPERWRVVVLGALRRGKSSLINAMAGVTVLRDEGNSVEMRFPVHVRYGPENKAFALGDDAAWDCVAFDTALEAATRTPVLIETPWSLPRQLVLVHTPAFDSGLPDAEQIAFAAAARASETLALFSRQLSDRELDIYGRITELGRPLTFVHTIADNEEPAERRNVVVLAERYLRERSMSPGRIFTISASDYRSCAAAQQPAAPWNEFLALKNTLEGRAAEHMNRLERAERERVESERLARSAAGTSHAAGRTPSFFDRLFGRR